MTTKKLKRVTIILTILLVAITFLIIYKHYQRYNQEYNATKTYEETSKDHKKIGELKTVVDANNHDIEEINRYLEQVKFNGTAAVFENGQLKLNKGYGMKNFKEDEKNRADTLYLIGSSQKFTTGLMLKQLVNEKKLNMNDPVTKYLPWFKTTQPITLNQLMQHKSGLYKYSASPQYKSLDEAVHAIQEKGIEPKYYNKNRYNDANYLVLSRVIEEATSKSYVKNFENRLANPYNLNFTAFFNDTDYQKNMAIGYKKDKTSSNPVKQTPNILDQYYGAGNLFMAPYDMGQLILSLQKNEIFDDKITQPLLHESLTSQYPEPYRYGFYSLPDKNRINGGFFGQVFTAYFNNKYIIVLGTNYENSQTNNEKKIKHIYYDILKQGGPYNIVGQKY